MGGGSGGGGLAPWMRLLLWRQIAGVAAVTDAHCLERHELGTSLCSACTVSAPTCMMCVMWSGSRREPQPAACLLQWAPKSLCQQPEQRTPPLSLITYCAYTHTRDAPESAASDAANSSNLLLSLLEQLDVRASVSKPASPEVCLAVLACPLVVEQLASTARQLHAALSSELELSSDVGLPSASEELAGGEPGSSPGSTGSAADWPGSEAAARQQPGASSSGRAGAGDAWAVLGALGPTAKAVLRGKQGLEALMRAAIVEAVKQVRAGC